jgi:peroxiredoxin
VLARLVLTAGLCLLPMLGAEVPRPMPDFTAQLPNGEALHLSQYKGKVLAVLFIFTTCPHCQDTCQMVNRVYADLGPKGLQPVAIAFDPMSHMKTADFVKQFNLKFPVTSASREAVHAFLQHPEILRLMVPQIVLVDRKGIIRQQTPADGDPNLQSEPGFRAAVEKLLKEPAAGGKTPSTQTRTAAKKKAS